MSKGLEPGSKFPDLELPDENGKRHRLSELQGDDVLVLMLGRGEHCPRERMHQREMVKFHEFEDVAFTKVVTILPNDLHDVHKLRISSGAHWPFLADEKLEARTRFEIDEYTDTHHDNAVVPHTLILAPGLVVDKVYVGYYFWGRPSVYRLWEDVGDLLRRIKDDFDPTTPQARAAWEASQNGAGSASAGPGKTKRPSRKKGQGGRKLAAKR
jgi:peroxiredoxin